MKVCIFGAGAIGGHLAGRLANGGADLSIVARGANLAAMQANGLVVRAPDGDMQVRPRLSADPAELGPQDAVVVCTKVPALGSVARAIGPLLGLGLDPGAAIAAVRTARPGAIETPDQEAFIHAGGLG